MNLLNFTVHGPFPISVEQRKKGKMIPRDCPNFWQEYPKYKKRQGCYIFAIRNTRGYRPIYVGKTTKTYSAECFTLHKIAEHYNPALLDIARGTPVMFFVTVPQAQGRPNQTKISSLEKFLTEVAASKNPELSNIQNKPKYEWGITGVIRCGKGKPSVDAKELKTLLGLRQR